MSKRTKFGLLGKDISYSFSKKYFTNKFEKLGLYDLKYFNFDIPEIEEFPFLIYHKEDEFGGMNVTIPYKEKVIKYLNELTSEAKEIGAVNTIKFTEDHRLIGHNTDAYGFRNSIEPLLKKHHTKALILGTGGASKAIAFVFKKLNIEYKYVSRSISNTNFSYSVLNKEIMNNYTIIVNCTPVGTYPKITESPAIPFEFISSKHLLFDLIYNPEETTFLREGKAKGAITINGSKMLELQAEKAWEIWNE